jgi:hypothetical protein
VHKQGKVINVVDLIWALPHDLKVAESLEKRAFVAAHVSLLLGLTNGEPRAPSFLISQLFCAIQRFISRVVTSSTST